MANIKITDLDAYTDPKSTDVLPAVDVTNDETKKVSIADLMENAGAGTESAPGIAFDGDPNTGIYHPAADQVAISTAGTQRLLISDTGAVTIPGNLTVQGTTTFIDSETLQVEDKNIEIGKVASPTDLTADGGGITLLGSTNKTLNWVDSTDSWTSSENVDLASGKTYKIAGTDVLSSSTLGSGVTGSSLTSVGTITTGVWNGTALTSSAIGADAIDGSKIADDSIDSEHYVDGSIDNVHVSASAAIAGTKIDPDFGSQTVETTGVFSAAGGAQATPSITFTGDLNTGIYSPGADQLALATNGTQRLFIDSTGNVGVGTTTKAWESNQFFAIQFGKGGSVFGRAAGDEDRNGFVSNAYHSAAGWKYIASSAHATRYDHNDGNHIWYYAGTGTADASVAFSEAMRIDTSGRLGVGTSAPSQLLTVDGTGLFGTAFDTASTSGYGVQITKGGGYAAVTTQATSAATDATLAFRAYKGTSKNFEVTCGGGGYFAGSVGVGTTSVGYKLDVAQTSSDNIVANLRGRPTDDQCYLRFASNDSLTSNALIGVPAANTLNIFTGGTERVRIDSSGRVGVGTSSPSRKLDVQDESTSTEVARFYSNASKTVPVCSIWQDGAGASGPALKLRNDGSGNALEVHDGSDGNITFVVDSSSRVGIGTTSPARALDVNGSADFAVPNAQGIRLGYRGETKTAYIGIDANDTYSVNQSWANSCWIGFESGASDKNILYRANSNHIFYGANATERARIDSSGRLLVGTTTSGLSYANIQVVGGAGGASSGNIRLSSTDITPGSSSDLGGVRFTDFNGGLGAQVLGVRDGGTWTSGSSHPSKLVFSTTADSASSPTERMRIGSNGFISFAGDTDTGISHISANTFGFYTANTERLRFASTGNILMHTGGGSPGASVTGFQASPSGYIFVSVNAAPAGYFNRNTSDGGLLEFRKDNVTVGSVSVTASATAYNTSSDYRLKENVAPLTGASDRVNQLQVHRFNFIADPAKTVDGFLAHEAQSVVPECVTGTKDEVDADGNPVYQGIDQSKLVPLLTAALQEALQKIEVLEQRLSDAGIA